MCGCRAELRSGNWRVWSGCQVFLPVVDLGGKALAIFPGMNHACALLVRCPCSSHQPLCFLAKQSLLERVPWLECVWCGGGERGGVMRLWGISCRRAASSSAGAGISTDIWGTATRKSEAMGKMRWGQASFPCPRQFAGLSEITVAWKYSPRHVNV